MKRAEVLIREMILPDLIRTKDLPDALSAKNRVIRNFNVQNLIKKVVHQNLIQRKGILVVLSAKNRVIGNFNVHNLKEIRKMIIMEEDKEKIATLRMMKR